MPEWRELVESGRKGRPGPVFLEICLDAQAAPALDAAGSREPGRGSTVEAGDMPAAWVSALAALSEAERPLILLGGGVSRAVVKDLRPSLEALGIPVALTWNAMDRLPFDSPVYAGRPNTWGMRWANLAIQQSDLIVALGTRLGLQQTGFAWQEFAPKARIVHVDLDAAELTKGRPRVEWKVEGDADRALASLVGTVPPDPRWESWLGFVRGLAQKLPLVEEVNLIEGPELVPQMFVTQLSDVMAEGDVLIPGSSGGAFTVAMQVFTNKVGQTVVSNKGLASMGYGLAGAIGACLANPDQAGRPDRGRRRLRAEPAGARDGCHQRPEPQDLRDGQPWIRLDPDDSAQLLQRRIRRLR